MPLKKITLGLIPSPDLPAKITSSLFDDLPNFLSSHVDDSVSWEPKIVIDPLIGSAEYMNQLMNKAVHLKNINNWDYVICLTDLPHFMEKHVVMADVSTENQVALVSIPSFGSFPIKHQTKQTISKILNDMHHINKINASSITRQEYNKNRQKSFFSLITRINLYNESEKTEETQGKEKNERTQEDTEKNSNIRYIIKSKLLGHLRILVGMTFANRAWTALISFKKVLMFAFGTGIYITLFPTPWELSTIYSIPRFILLMFVAIFGMVTWVIFAHKLWEKPTKQGDVRLRKLYNYTTITTLTIIVLINYIVLYCLLMVTIGIFVPPELFEAGTDLKDDATLKYYFQLTWLITSLGTLAGSIGTTSENEEKIRQITYSYRQINRYYEIQDANDKDEDGVDKEQEEKDRMKRANISRTVN